jgi:hypothetical protein
VNLLHRILLSIALCASSLAITGASSGQNADPHPNLPLSPDDLMQIMQIEELEITQVRGAGAGVMGTKRIKVRVKSDLPAVSALEPGSDLIKLKWKKALQVQVDGWNNSPRIEIAAYELQKLFLDPEDFVVPPTTTRCFSLDTYVPVQAKPESSFMMARCVYGMLAAWLRDVTLPKKLMDWEMFRDDPHYASQVSSMNLVTYLIQHKDVRSGNVLISSRPGPPRIYLVDNGLAFGVRLYNFMLPNWKKIRLPSLEKAAIERLRKVTRADLDAYGVMVEMHVDEGGILQHAPLGENLDPGEGLRIEPGKLQLGLTRKEIDGIAKRIERLLADVDSGKLGTF